MKSRGVFILFLFLLGFEAFPADWRRETVKHFSGVPNYEGAARLLLSLFPSAAPEEKPQMSLLLAFIYQRLEQKENEQHWLKELFESRGDRALSMDFLGDATAIEVIDFLMKWRDQYPLSENFSLIPEACSFAERPAQFILALQARNTSEYRLWRSGVLLSEGMLVKGENRLALAGISLERTQSIDDLEFETSTPVLSVRKKLHVEVTLSCPADAEIVDGRMKIKEKAFRPEQEVHLEIRKIRHFDSRYFFRHAGLCLVVAGGVMACDLLLCENKIAGGNLLARAAPYQMAMHQVLPFASAGFAAKAMIGFFRSFKVRVERREIEVPSLAAVEYNRFLTASICQAERDTVIESRIRISGFQ